MDIINLIGETAKAKPHMKDEKLMVVAIAIPKGAIHGPKKKVHVDTVDSCKTVPEIEDVLITETFVLIVVGLCGYFKHPVAYVLQDK